MRRQPGTWLTIFSSVQQRQNHVVRLGSHQPPTPPSTPSTKRCPSTRSSTSGPKSGSRHSCPAWPSHGRANLCRPKQTSVIIFQVRPPSSHLWLWANTAASEHMDDIVAQARTTSSFGSTPCSSATCSRTPRCNRRYPARLYPSPSTYPTPTPPCGALHTSGPCLHPLTNDPRRTAGGAGGPPRRACAGAGLRRAHRAQRPHLHEGARRPLPGRPFRPGVAAHAAVARSPWRRDCGVP